MSVAGGRALGPAGAADRFRQWITRTGLAESTKATYCQYVDQYTRWLAEQGDQYASALTDPDVRDWAVRDWRRVLRDAGRSPKTIDVAYTAVSAMYTWDGIGLGAPRLRQVTFRPRNREAPRSLGADEQRMVLRLAEKRGARDYSLVTLMMFAGPRVGEVVGLNVDDVWVSDRKGEVELFGKGDKVRRVPLNVQAREAMRAWQVERKTWPVLPRFADALFLSREGRRIAVRSVQNMMAQIGDQAGIDHLTPHALRHTCATTLLQSGADVTQVADLLGHRSLETTRGYTRSTGLQLADMVERITVEH